MPDIDNTDIYELLRIMNSTPSKDSNVKTVKANESLIGAITGTDPRNAG
nr:hypothetical protein [Mammaliicoccus sp. Marseille-Q6498]